jgi:NAD(P)-dependent dehydrogenase (short-subunit alcohol dehydrogenase family)
LGLATVQELLLNGALVAILDVAKPPEGLSNTRFVKTDVTSIPSIESALEVVKAWSSEINAPIRGVINCAGVVKVVKMVDREGNPHDVESWEKTIAINQSGTFHLTRLVVKQMTNIPPEEGEDGERGVVIMVASEAAVSRRINIGCFVFAQAQLHFAPCAKSSSSHSQHKLLMRQVKVL